MKTRTVADEELMREKEKEGREDNKAKQPQGRVRTIKRKLLWVNERES